MWVKKYLPAIKKIQKKTDFINGIIVLEPEPGNSRATCAIWNWNLMYPLKLKALAFGIETWLELHSQTTHSIKLMFHFLTRGCAAGQCPAKGLATETPTFEWVVVGRQ